MRIIPRYGEDYVKANADASRFQAQISDCDADRTSDRRKVSVMASGRAKVLLPRYPSWVGERIVRRVHRELDAVKAVNVELVALKLPTSAVDKDLHHLGRIILRTLGKVEINLITAAKRNKNHPVTVP